MCKCFGNITHESIGNYRPLIGLPKQVIQSEAWFPIDLYFQHTYASKTLAHDPALILLKFLLVVVDVEKIGSF